MQARSNHNKATCAPANKLARICYATLRDKSRFGDPTVRLGKKINRESFAMPAWTPALQNSRQQHEALDTHPTFRRD